MPDWLFVVLAEAIAFAIGFVVGRSYERMIVDKRE